jgi:hypothetical protein
MPMRQYAVLCYTPGCGKPAVYKVASRWSDGVTSELKTYGLTCAECLPAWLKRARERQAACRVAAGETLEKPGIYHVECGRRDQHLERCAKLEADLAE